MDAQRQLDALCAQVLRVARLLPALTPQNGPGERQRLVASLRAGAHAAPRWELRRSPVPRDAFSALERVRELSRDNEASELYLARADELELELCLVDAIGDVKRVRPLSARRFGTGARRLAGPTGEASLHQIARRILDEVEDDRELPTLPAQDPRGGPSMVAVVEALCVASQLEVEVRVEPRLVSKAAAGERTVFIADQRFGVREARRLAVHEVLGHMVAHANGRLQPTGLLTIGTAGAFEDQEGLALCLEEAAGLLDGHRLRTVAARVLAADAMHAGVSYHEATVALIREHGFEVEDAVATTERAYRGGGVAKDVGYLHGYLRVRAALGAGDATIDELRMGKASVEALPTLRRLVAAGSLRAPVYRPSLARSLGATGLGTSFDTSPPSFVTSLQSPEAT